jgi:hypothetical protein
MTRTSQILNLKALIVGVVGTGILLVAPAARAGAPTVRKPGDGGHRYLGAMIDVGVPDVIGVSFVGRPLRWLRLHAGGSCNLVSGGIRGGVTLVPFDFKVSPSLTLEGGYTFEGDANWLTEKFGFSSRVLERIGYGYASAHLGLELGTPNRFIFFIHGGISLVVAKVHRFQDVLQDEAGDSSIDFSDPTLTIFTPSGKLGFVLYF